MKTPVAIAFTFALSFCCMTSSRADDAATKPASARPATTQAATTRTAATRPARGKSPEAKAAEDAIRTAVLALTKEAQDAYKKPNGSPPRTESDYFKDKSPGIDQDTLLTVLGKSLARDPRVDAYIKLQLLSAVETFDAAHAKDAINAYVKAPALVPLPVMNPREMQTWDQRVNGAKQEEIGELNAEFQQQRSAGEAMNAPMIAYRNAFATKIATDESTKPRLLQARVEDLHQRATAGFDTRKPWQTLATEINAWAAVAKRQQIGGMMAFLKDYTRRIGPTVYEELYWSTRGRTSKPDWKEYKASLDAKRMTWLLDELNKAQANAM